MSDEQKPDDEIDLTTATLPKAVVELVRKIRGAEGITLPEVYMRYAVPALERRWASIVHEEHERLRAEDPAFANELGEAGA